MRHSNWYLLLALFWSTLSPLTVSADDSLGWNETKIAWLGYEEGLEMAREEGKPALLVFYANWCHTCHRYRELFHNPDIEALANELVMIRVNVDSRPDLNLEFSEDGLYLPRSFGLTSNGELLALTSNNRQFRYFYADNDITAYGNLMKNIGMQGITQL